jgi:hypothetical protein
MFLVPGLAAGAGLIVTRYYSRISGTQVFCAKIFRRTLRGGK